MANEPRGGKQREAQHEIRSLNGRVELDNRLRACVNGVKDKWAKVGGWAETDATYALISKTHNHYLEQERLLEEEM